MNAPLGLTDKQLELVRRASSLLTPYQRGSLLRSLACRLVSHPTDAAVTAAIISILDNAGISAASLGKFSPVIRHLLAIISRPSRKAKKHEADC